MDNLILISNINDFIFCPISIYFHNLYGFSNDVLFKSESQLNGLNANATIDEYKYSTKTSIITSLDVYCEKYGLVGKIDILDIEKNC